MKPRGGTSLWLLLSALATGLATGAARGASPASAPLEAASLEAYRDVLPQQTVRALFQDRDGYIWIGTWDGLVRSNGVDFRVFRRESGLPSDSVAAILEDSGGTLWVGTNEGLARRKEAGFEDYAGNGALPDRHVTSLHAGPSGGLFVGTGAGLCQVVDGRVLRLEAAPDAPPPGPIHGMAALDGRLLVSTDQGVLSYGPDGYRDEMAGLPPQRFRSLAVAPNGTLYAGTDARGVARRKGGVWSFLGTGLGLPTPSAKALFLDPSGALWVGTEGGGVCAVRSPEAEAPRVECLSPQRGLTSGVIRSLLVDAEGTLWAGTANGLNAIREQRFHVMETRHGLPEENVRNVLESRSGDLWLGTEGAGVVRVSGGRVDVWNQARGLASDLVRSLGEDADGGIWVGTNGGGASRIDPRTGRVQTFDARGSRSLSSNLVLSLHAASDGSIWLGNDAGTLDVYRKGRWEHRPVLPDASGQPAPLSTFRIHEAPGGAVWLGTSRGLCRLSDGRAQLYSQGLAATDVYALHETSRGTFLVGAQGGLYLFSGGRFQSVRRRDGVWDFTVFEILEDRPGNLWLTSNRGVSLLAKEAVESYVSGLTRELEGRTFDESDGLRSRQCNGSSSPAGARGRDGRLFIPTNRGLAIVDPERAEPEPPTPKVVIAGAFLDGISAFSRTGLVVPPDTRRLELLYDAPTFLAPRRLLFQFRLEGFDDGWIEAGTSRSASYTSLPPGTYLFSVRCGTPAHGFGAEGATFRVTVQPRLDQRTWVRLLVAGLVVATLGLLVRLRLRRLARVAESLEETVRSRTAELSHANDRLLDANSRLERANQEMRQLSEERAEFLGIAAHDLKSPLSIVVGYAHLLRQANLAAGERVLVDRIVHACGRMKDLIENLLGASALEQGSVAVSPEPLDVAEVVRAGLRGHHDAAEAKGQRILAELPETPVPALADPKILEQVIDNLVSNAIKYSPRGKTIRVRVLRRAGGRIRLEVADEGPGLTERDRERLFQKFARLSARPTGGEGSTGLGLAIVSKLAELTGASVWCDSEPGQGATFVFELPAEGRASAPSGMAP